MNTGPTARSRSILQIAIASVLWGVSYFFYKVAVIDQSAVFVSFWFSISATLFLLPIAIHQPFAAAFGRYPLHYLCLGLFSGPCAAVLIAHGLKSTPVGVGSVIAKLEAVFVIAIAWVALGERLSRKQVIWSAIALCSTPVVVLGDIGALSENEVQLIPALFIVGGGACFAACVVIARFLATSGEQPLTMIFLRTALGGVLTLPLGLFVDDGLLAGISWRGAAVIFVASATTTVAFLLFYAGLRHARAGIASVIELLTPMVAVLMGVVWLDESISITRTVAMAVLIVSVMMASGIEIPRTFSSRAKAS
ncbi:MAG: DMT family transporter [Deltaproteobacteria bacterium]|nr:DMT family transporter [Deltaproteobacteria bacterium]